MKEKGGFFVISLDFELYWGMLDAVPLSEYGERIRGERTAIPRMLALFSKYGIHATWGTVGMLMARNKTELTNLLPEKENRPTYSNQGASTYTHIETAAIEENDIHYFGGDLLTKILETPFQEVGNHTFSHFYCLDEKITDRSRFIDDLHAFSRIAETYGILATSLIFPRNQYTELALRDAKKAGIQAYRGNENHVLYAPRKYKAQTLIVRLFRLLDHYINISGHHTYPIPQPTAHEPINIPASRFFRPWNVWLNLFEPLRIRRIKRAMTHAAKNNEIFHLWWHPHNVSIDQGENFKNLEHILKHYLFLKETYGMTSASMADITKCTVE